MKKMLFLPFAALFFTSLALCGQQSGGLTAQQVMSALAGMRSDITLMADDNRRLAIRIEALEEELAKKNNQIRDLQSTCDTLAQQNQSLETRLMDLGKAIEADQTQRQKELQALSSDIKKTIKNSPTQTPAPQQSSVPTLELKIEKGDTLSSIAKMAKCTVKEIMALNPSLKSADDLRVGQVILVPKK